MTLETNNIANIKGSKIHDLVEYHTILDEKFYKGKIHVSRNSNVVDKIPVVISEKLLEKEILNADFISLTGQVRSYNNNSGNVEIYVFVKEIETLEKEESLNEIILTGFICKKGNIRTTKTARKITDFILAVNRLFKKSDYLPILAWGKDAIYIDNREISTKLSIVGRFQSRAYNKTMENGDIVEREVYEISSSRISIAKDIVSEEENIIAEQELECC